jgi:hypothetical protein
MTEQTGEETQEISKNYKKFNRCFGGYDPGSTRCPNTPDGFHRCTITGQPLSGNTYYECVACGLRWFRG